MTAYHPLTGPFNMSDGELLARGIERVQRSLPILNPEIVIKGKMPDGRDIQVTVHRLESDPAELAIYEYRDLGPLDKLRMPKPSQWRLLIDGELMPSSNGSLYTLQIEVDGS